jgi:hypothetical protein
MLKYFQIFIYFILFSTRAKNASHRNTTHATMDNLYPVNVNLHL